MKVAILAVAVLASCADHKPSPVASSGSGSAATTKPGGTMNAAVTVTLVGQKPGRPPIARLLVDVQAKNDDAAPRWLLFPSKIPPEQGGVDKLEQLTVAAGATSVAVGRFLGRGRTYALLLAPGARVHLHNLEVAWWRDEGAKEARLDIQIASQVKIGQATMASWFDKDPTISGAIDVDMETAKHTSSHRAPDDAEQPLAIEGATHVPVKLAVP